MNFKQGELRKKIILFLEKQFKKSPDTEKSDRRAFIEVLANAGGHCTGYSLLWAFAKISSDINDSDKADDNNYFNKMLRLIDSIDEKSEFSKDEENELDRFISNIFFFQNSTGVLFVENELMENIESVGALSGGFKKDVDISPIIHSKETLTRTLTELVQEQEIVFLSFSTKSPENSEFSNPIFEERHIVTIYKSSRDGKIYFYDSNNEKGEVVAENVAELVEKIWEISDPKKIYPIDESKVDYYIKSNYFLKARIQAFSSRDHGSAFNFRATKEEFETECKTLRDDEFLSVFSHEDSLRISSKDKDVQSFMKRLQPGSVVTMIKENAARVADLEPSKTPEMKDLLGLAPDISKKSHL